jgi:hypothetical protein
MGCICSRRNRVNPDCKNQSGSTAKDSESQHKEVFLFVVKEEQSYMEQSYVPSKRQSVAHNSGKLLDSLADLENKPE